MLSENYSYAERPAALILGRRGFLKVCGLCVGAVAVCGYAIGDMIARRGAIIAARQAGLYKDLGTKPVDHTMHELLHTHYYARTMLASEVNHG